MPASEIVIRGAREHNLRDVSLSLPRNQLIVMTGVSGSGKSSLAFDTLYAEGQRRYVESLSSYARQFLGQMPKPDVDAISGLAPCISIQQKVAGRNPRSTVGTMTEIYDYLRVLFARVGQGYCYVSGKPIQAQTVDQIVESILKLADGTKYQILAPVIQQQKGEFRDLFEDLLKKGFLRARVDGEFVSLNNPPTLRKNYKHTIEVVIDRLVAGKGTRNRLAEAIESATKLADGTLILKTETSDSESKTPATSSRKNKGRNAGERIFSTKYACPESGMSYEPPSPQLFSFNSPLGMCHECNGLGIRVDFVIDKLLGDPSLSIFKGIIHLLGPFRSMGRWRRHLYEGAAAAIEEDCDLKPGTMLKTPWEELPQEARHLFLHGTGERHVTYSWRTRGSVWKHGGTYAGVIPELMESYRTARNPMRRRQLENYMESGPCTSCEGTRLNRQARNVRLKTANKSFIKSQGKTEFSLPEVVGFTIGEAHAFFESLDLNEAGHLIAEEVLKEIRGRLGFLLRCGLDYLTLDRSAPTLSGGESQRIRLAGQIGCGLVGVVYILDEPSIGLHPRDNTMLLESLCDLRDQGNTVIVVEHDEETMQAADYIVDFGPGPGIRGGEIVAHGSLADIKKKQKSLTSQYLSGKRKIEVPKERRGDCEKSLTIKGAEHHNLQNVDVRLPLERFVCITGVSGSGKSSLTNDILWQVLNRDLNKGKGTPGKHASVEGLEHLDKAIDIDQSPIGRTPRSNPATYVKVFDLIRNLYAQLPTAKMRGYKPGRFSFNVEGGRCEYCEGHGATKLEMDFLADIWVDCPVCETHRFNRETLEVLFKEKSIAEVLEMDIQEAMDHFEPIPKIHRLLQTLHDVGLDYLKLGQPSPTLSGGEAQRIKLARELGKRSTGNTLYLLDEPTTGLHFADVEKLLEVLHGFVDRGNSVIVVEHNLDVIKTADWVIDLGPDGGAGGGKIVAEGPPETIAECEESFTGVALRDVLPDFKKRSTRKKKATSKAKSANGSGRWQSVGDTFNGDAKENIVVHGARQHNLQDVDVTVPRDRMTVFCGPSGSGKSSLAMDTLYAEGQRRYVESLSSYARQFLGQMPKPQVENIRGLSPAIAIEQKTVGSTPRSTVGTVTEVYDYLRVIFSRLGEMFCPNCDIPVTRYSADDVVDQILKNADGSRLLVLAPVTLKRAQTYDDLFESLNKQGFARVRIDGETFSLNEVPKLDRRASHEIDIVIDRVSVSTKNRSRLTDSVEAGLEAGNGILRIAYADSEKPEPEWRIEQFSRHLSCANCGEGFEHLSPQNFSFNSPLGWCDSCEGLGVEQGTSQSALIGNPERSLRDGAIIAWPSLQDNKLFGAILEAMSHEFDLPLDVPYSQLTSHQQRLILYGNEDKWLQLNAPYNMQVQYKGLYPAIYEATRVSYSHRQSLHELVGEQACSVCQGTRIRSDAAAVRFRNHTLSQVCQLSLQKVYDFFCKLKLSAEEKQIAGELLEEVKGRLQFLVEVGLDYLNLDRSMPTLSGGESQRIRLAGQLGRSLTGVLYVLDEPTIGLHPRDNDRLLKSLKRLRDLGNTVVLVEHDREVLQAADRLYDFGPGAGRLGGTIVSEGTAKQLSRRKESLTGQYLADKAEIPIPKNRRMPSIQEINEVSTSAKSREQRPEGSWLELIGARQNNLRNVDLRIPLGTFTCVTGVSGSGKSSLVQDTLARAVSKKLNRSGDTPGPFDELIGIEHINKLVVVDQKPIGSTPASNPATYTGVFEPIRDLFSRLPEAKIRGFKPGRFSFNRPGGRCEDCEGMGQKCIEMHFLPDVWVECLTCRGKRYNQETLAVTFRDNSIADVLEMPIGDAAKLFENIPKVRGPLTVLAEIGLDYLTLGQSAPTLSGGESQRVKLAAELARPQSGKSLYLLDEPTTGLHFDDIAKLLRVLNSLVEAGNTVVVIEHNLDVIKTADWIIDVGPEAGSGGGYIVAEGTPEDIVQHSKNVAETNGVNGGTFHPSHTGDMLRPVLETGTLAERDVLDVQAIKKKKSTDVEMKDIGKEEQTPWEKDGRRWHTIDRISHAGKPAQWDGAALDFVIDLMAEDDRLAEPNWNHRSIVEVKRADKRDQWFFHARTGGEWAVHLGFMVPKAKFDKQELLATFNFPPFDEMKDLPVYGREPRIRVHNKRGPWQEVVLQVHSLDEIDTPEFREFLQSAIDAFIEATTKKASNPEDAMPWKQLGRKWHTSRKGFPSNKRVAWPVGLLDELFDLLLAASPNVTADWDSKSVVKFYGKNRKAHWAEVHTKRRAGIDLILYDEPGGITLGEISSVGATQEIAPARDGREAAKIRLKKKTQLDAKTLKPILKRIVE